MGLLHILTDQVYRAGVATCAVAENAEAIGRGFTAAVVEAADLMTLSVVRGALEEFSGVWTPAAIQMGVDVEGLGHATSSAAVTVVDGEYEAAGVVEVSLDRAAATYSTVHSASVLADGG